MLKSVIFVIFCINQYISCGAQFGEVPKPTKHVSARDVDQSLFEGEAVLDDFYTRYATTKEVDLVFVLDRSGSVPRQGWAAMSNFVYDMLQHFTVDSNNTRVAVVTFSSDVTVDIDDLSSDSEQDENDKCTLYQRIKRTIETKIPYGYTGTYAALAQAYKVLLNARSYAKKAVLVVTDGKSNIGPPPVRAAFDILSLQWDPNWNETALGPQVEIYGFGIDDAYQPELNSMASPLPNHTFLIPTFEAFETFARRLHGGKQREHWLSTVDTHCSNRCPGVYSHCMCGAHRGHYACVCDPGYQKLGQLCSACDEGYYKDSTSQAMCVRCPENTTTEGKASTHKDQCQLLPGLQKCPDLPPIDDGYAFYVPGTHTNEVVPTDEACSGVRDGNSCHYTCDEGFWMQGSPILHCNRTGMWEGQVPQCKEIDCEHPDNLGWVLLDTIVTLVNGTTTYGSVIQATCADNLVPIGTTTWECDRHGRWTKPWNFQCVEIKCPPVPKIPFTTSSPDSCGKYRQPYSTECTLQCMDGFNMEGQSKLTCDFERTATWTPQPWPNCTDVKPPVILCPADKGMMVTNWGDNFTMVHIEADQALASDNSGNFTIKVNGVPENNVFMIGHTEVTYTATDGSGNEASCVRDVHIMAKKAGVLFCPLGEVVVMNSADRVRDVKWKDPIFVDSMNNSLAYTCFPEGPFQIGVQKVQCSANDFPGVKCTFNIEVKVPECPVPFSNKPPLHGAVICGQPVNKHYPRVCRVHCQKGHVLREYEPDHQFVCDWDGNWKDLENGWPHCYRARRASSALTIGQIHVAYAGSCEDNKDELEANFVETLLLLLSKEGGPCTGESICSVSEVNVICGGGRAKRSINDTLGGVEMQFTMSASLDIDGHQVTDSDQKNLLFELDDMFFTLEDEILNGDFQLEINNETLSVSNLTTVQYAELQLNNCTQIAEVSTTDYRARCLSCAPGMYFVNNTCIDCPVGTYQDQSGQTFCIDCPQNTTSNPGSYSACQCEDLDSRIELDKSSLQELEYKDQCYVCTSGSNNCTDELKCGPYCFHGDCEAAGNDVICVCHQGYIGDRCDVIVTACSGMDCNNGTCIEDPLTNFTCVCQQGYTGDFCEALAPECSKDTCNHGYCIDKNGSHTCVCDDGWVGLNCDVIMSECSAKICGHGNCSFDDGRVLCECFEGFIGDKCQYAENPCEDIVCKNNGTCVRQDLIGYCVCKTGFTGDTCEMDIDVCYNLTCSNNGSCIDVDGHPKCKCTSGYTGNLCQNEISSDFDLVFRTGQIDDFVSIRPLLRALSTVSSCMWVRTQDVSNYGTMFSYAADNEWGSYDGVDAFTLHDCGKIQLSINGDTVATDIAVNDGHWHHVCVTWDNNQGEWSVVINGSVKDYGEGLAVGSYIHPGGYLILGQRQDTVGDGFNQREAFIGEIHQLNIYSYNITDTNFTVDCNQAPGDVMTWTEVIGHVVNEVEIRNSSWCLDPNECLTNGTCPSRTVCVDTKGSYKCIETPAGTCPDIWCHHGGVCNMVSNKSQCQCKPQYTGRWCEDLVSDTCASVQCQNNGMCVNGHCNCKQEFSGEFCEHKTKPCTTNQCHNGATCLSVGSDYQCICLPNWKGQNCQTYFSPSCWHTPCLNEGVCVEDVSNEEGYICNCTEDSMGSNCEISACLSQPCLNGGSCIQGKGDSFICLCPLGYEGIQCGIYTTTTPAPTTTTKPTPRDWCMGIDCSNGGVCKSRETDFHCNCKQDYTGTYCETKRNKHTFVYNARVSLNEPYTNDLSSNASFQNQFAKEVHKLYQPVLQDSKVRITVTGVYSGSVVVSFDVVHTNYTDGRSPGMEEMRLILARGVDSGKLGQWKTTMDKFYFTLQYREPAQGSLRIWLSIVVVLLVLAFVVMVLCIFRRRRRNNRHKPMRMNNLSQMVHFRIRNQTSHPEKAPPSPTVRIHSVQEDIYAEPETEPYSVTPMGSRVRNSPILEPRFPSKRGMEINKTLGNRQSIPLPPRPDERPTLNLPRCTPPPAYKDAISKSFKVDNANINPTNGTAKYSPREVYYFTPISESPRTPPVSLLDDRKKPVTDDNKLVDDVYLTPRESAVKSRNDIEDNVDNTYLTPVNKDDIYLTPVNNGDIEFSKETNDNIINDNIAEDNPYLDPVSNVNKPRVKEATENIDIDSEYIATQTSNSNHSSEELIPSDHESDEEHFPTYKNQLS